MKKFVSAAATEWIADGTTGRQEITRCQQVHSNLNSTATSSQLSSKIPDIWRLSLDLGNIIWVVIFFKKKKTKPKQWTKLSFVRQNKIFSILF